VRSAGPPRTETLFGFTAAKQRGKNFEARSIQMAEHYDDEIDRVQENVNDSHRRIDHHLEGHPVP